ncbi:hypothetical protein PCI56_11525 [Plesiomonas shigelloides subsp. oncorhynchi]|nr:hypothetical protein [Plesiomonas shigelloides]
MGGFRFELVARYASAQVMRNLGKLLVVDTAEREQRFISSLCHHFCTAIA